MTAETSTPNPELLRTSDEAKHHIDAIATVLSAQSGILEGISVRHDAINGREERAIGVDVLPPASQDGLGFRVVSNLPLKKQMRCSAYPRVWGVQYRVIDTKAPALYWPEDAEVKRQVFYWDASKGPINGYEVDGTDLPNELEATKYRFGSAKSNDEVVAQREALFIELVNQHRQALGEVLFERPELLAAIDARAQQLSKAPIDRSGGMAELLGNLFGRHRNFSSH